MENDGGAGLEVTFSISIPQRINYMEAMETQQENTNSCTLNHVKKPFPFSHSSSQVANESF